MSYHATKRDLEGRRIVRVEFNRFSDGRGGQTTRPVLVLDSGRRVWIVVEETEGPEYGVRLCIHPREGIL